MRQLTLALIFSVLIFSCSSNKNKVEEPTNEVSEPIADAIAESNAEPAAASSGANLFASAETLQKAEDALRNLPQFKGKALNVFQTIHFYGDGRIMVSIQDPNKPENVDEYNYEGGAWGEPVPMQITGGGDMKSNVYSLDKTPFVTANKIYTAWEEKAKSLGDPVTNECSHIYASLWVPTQTVKWRTDNVETARGAYQFTFNLDGSVKSFDKQ